MTYSRGGGYRELAKSSVPSYRRSPTCFNCANCIIEGFFGEDSRCKIHPCITYWEMGLAEMRMKSCYCDDWEKIQGSEEEKE